MMAVHLAEFDAALERWNRLQASFAPNREYPYRAPYRQFLVPLSIFLLLMGFIAAPFPLEQKAHALMHGICAQRPSHSFTMGGSALPFDARMTGIYLGFFVAFVLLILTGRHRRAGFLSVGSLVVLLVLVGSMAVDGFNSLFTDLRLPTLYEPSNNLRLLTGLGAGVGLAIMLAMLVGMSIWRKPDTRLRVTDRWWQPFALYAAGMPLALLVLHGERAIYVPATLLLVISATVAFSSLALVSMVMIAGRENSFGNAYELQPFLVLSMIGGVVTIASLALLRFGFEAVTNAPPLT
jgi:uncharacterized membrane protein